MKVRMLRSPAFTLGCDLKEGEEGSVSTELANYLLALGIAEAVVEPEPKSKTLKAVSSKPQIADTKEPEITE